MTIFLLSFFIGVVAGLRAMMAPAVASWSVHWGVVTPAASWLAFMGYRFTPWVFSALAVAELITDQLPSTPSRKAPVQFGTRVLMGGLAGATIGAGAGSWVTGAVLGAIGAVAGTVGGAAARARLAAIFGKDRPAALIEDAVAIIASALIIAAMR